MSFIGRSTAGSRRTGLLVRDLIRRKGRHGQDRSPRVIVSLTLTGSIRIGVLLRSGVPPLDMPRDCGGRATGTWRARGRHGRLVPMTTIVDLTPAARRLSELVQHIDDDQLGAPTPSGIPVAGMLDHVGGLAVAFAAAAAKDLGSVTATPPAPDGDRLGTAWRAEIPRALTALAQAWTDPAAWQGMTQVGGVTLPGEIAGQVALDEVVLHAWDLARGTGQPYQQDPATLDACLAAMTGMYPPDDLDARKGIFEPPVPVPDDAPLVDRVVAYSGRDPGWPGR
jgi:uncharacterized protein (TIGR03086 family)